jgi:hypothetical protein
MNLDETSLNALKIVVLASVFFVWVVRYDNIIAEFKQYNYPSWLRDLVGILKIAFVIMLFNDDRAIVLLGSGGIATLMLAALFTHLKVKNPIQKMLPSLTLMISCILIYLSSR